MRNSETWGWRFSAIGVLIVFALLGAFLFQPEAQHKAYAASANITIGSDIATIEVDTTQRTATKDLATRAGYIVNGGSTAVFISYTLQTVPTTDAQAQGVIKLPGSATISIMKGFPSFKYISTGTSVLYWFPEE